MLAMWHRVVTQPDWMFSMNTGIKTPDTAKRFIAKVLPQVRECDFRIVANQVAEWCIGKPEQHRSEIGNCFPVAKSCWIEAVANNKGKEEQFGILVSLLGDNDGVTQYMVTYFSTLEGHPYVISFECAMFDAQKNFIGVSSLKSNSEGISRSGFPLMVFAFLHCKNVEQIDITKEHGPGRKWCKRQRVPEVTYKTLRIPGFPNYGETFGSGGESDAAGQTRMHIVRGHFATYTADKPLFGRPDGVGKFWHPAHVRGNMKNGAVVKDYEVVPPPAPVVGPAPSEN